MYKGGQAGVTKATVTITFDNTDKKQSPLGYETFDEITVSRQVRVENMQTISSKTFVKAKLRSSQCWWHCDQ